MDFGGTKEIGWGMERGRGKTFHEVNLKSILGTVCEVMIKTKVILCVYDFYCTV